MENRVIKKIVFLEKGLKNCNSISNDLLLRMIKRILSL